MYQFSGHANVFNGRHWKKYEVREKATSFPLATKRCTESAIKQHREASRKRSVKIEAVNVTIERLGRIVSATVQEESAVERQGE